MLSLYRQPSLPSITKGPRESNFEFLRILAMFLVLVFHADFWSLGEVTRVDFINNPRMAWTRTAIGAVSVMCVNIFVLISGWFGIKPTIKGVSNFIFQWLYFYIGSYLVMLCLGYIPFSISGLAACLGFSKFNWFVKAYLALYIIAPILNIFIEKADKRVIKLTIIFFLIFQTVYGWTGSVKFFEQGYSTFSFIGLYILGHHLRSCKSTKYKWGGVMCISAIILNIPLIALQMYLDVGPGVHSYVNPLVILSAIGIIMMTATLKIPTNGLINWVAASAFGVYLLHHAPAIGSTLFRPAVESLYYRFSGVECIIVIFLFLIIVFILAVLLDQPRKWLWKIMNRKIQDLLSGK